MSARKLFTNPFYTLLCAITLLLAGCTAASEATPISPEDAQRPTESVALEALTSDVSSPETSSPLITAESEQQRKVYQGANSYRGEHLFEIHYDAAQWIYGNAGPFGPSLKHLGISGCYLLLLDAGQVQSDAIGSVRLADREWEIRKTKDTEHRLYRFAPYEFSASVFYDPTVEGLDACYQAAEEVIDTFQPMSE